MDWPRISATTESDVGSGTGDRVNDGDASIQQHLHTVVKSHGFAFSVSM